MLVQLCQFCCSSTWRKLQSGCLQHRSSKVTLTSGKRRPTTQPQQRSQLKLQSAQSQRCRSGFLSSNMKKFQFYSISGFQSFPQPLLNNLQNVSRSHDNFDNQVWLKVWSMSKFIRGGYQITGSSCWFVLGLGTQIFVEGHYNNQNREKAQLAEQTTTKSPNRVFEKPDT